MKKMLAYMLITLAVCLGFKMAEPYFSDEITSQGYISDYHDAQMEAFLSAQSNDMIVPHLVNSVPTPIIHFTSVKRIQKTATNILIVKKLSTYYKILKPKNSPQLLCCFASPHDLFVVLLRHLII